MDGRPGVRRRQPRAADSPAGPRRRDPTADRYGLNAYIFDSTTDGTVNYDRVLFSKTKSGAAPDVVGTLAKGQWADVKVTLHDLPLVNGQPNPLNGQTAGMLVKVEELTGNLDRVRLFHTSVSRALATWPTWGGEPGFTGSFEEYLAKTFPTSTAADFAILEAGVTSEDTYVEQGLYWATGHVPMLKYVANKQKPDLLLVGMPTTDEFQHQFLGLVSPKLPGGAANPAYDDVFLDGTKDNRVAQREAYIRTAYQEADEVLTLARSLLGKNPTTFVSSDHGFAPQFLAIDASKPLVDLNLQLGAPQLSNCRITLPTPPPTDTRITANFAKAKACWAGGALQVYLNVVNRDPDPRPANARNAKLPDGTDNPLFMPDPRIPADQVNAVVGQIKAAFLALKDPTDWNHDGNPDNLKMIDRAFTKAEARYVPTGGGQTADMAHPTRTGDLVVFAYPPYQYDAETPGTIVAPSHFFGQHGYVPDVQDLAANINMRATFLAGGTGIAKGSVTARSIDLAPTLAFILGIPEPQHSQGKVLLDVVKGGNGYKPISIVGLNDFHGQLDPATLVGTTASRRRRRRRVPGHDVRPGVRSACPARRCSSPRATTSAPRRRTRACSRTCRRSTSRTCGASTPRRSATTSSTTASSGWSSTSTARTSRSSRRTSSRSRRATRRTGSSRRRCSPSTASRSASSAPSSSPRPSSSSAGATAGLTSWPKGRGSRPSRSG